MKSFPLKKMIQTALFLQSKIIEKTIFIRNNPLIIEVL